MEKKENYRKHNRTINTRIPKAPGQKGDKGSPQASFQTHYRTFPEQRPSFSGEHSQKIHISFVGLVRENPKSELGIKALFREIRGPRHQGYPEPHFTATSVYCADCKGGNWKTMSFCISINTEEKGNYKAGPLLPLRKSWGTIFRRRLCAMDSLTLLETQNGGTCWQESYGRTVDKILLLLVFNK